MDTQETGPPIHRNNHIVLTRINSKVACYQRLKNLKPLLEYARFIETAILAQYNLFMVLCPPVQDFFKGNPGSSEPRLRWRPEALSERTLPGVAFDRSHGLGPQNWVAVKDFG